jgi:uncharacterized protein (DUF1810 family)
MPPTSDPHDLARFVHAQQSTYPAALAEIRAGEKQSHWMWFIFPQIAGLGSSPMAQRYAIQSLAEARAYLAHPILGRRLIECAEALLAVESRSADDIFGPVDAMKLRSSATLFAEASAAGSVFHRVLERYFGGAPDDRTLSLLGA